MLCETRGSVRGLNRWEYEWLALSPNFNAQQHRWRENSYVFFKFTNNGRRSDIYSVRFWDVFRVKECIEFWSGRSSKTIAVNVSFLLRRQYAIYRKAFFLPLEHLYIYSFNRISTASFAGKKIWTKKIFTRIIIKNTKKNMSPERLLEHWAPDAPNGCNPLIQRCRVTMILRFVSDGGGSRTKIWRLFLPLECSSNFVELIYI